MTVDSRRRRVEVRGRCRRRDHCCRRGSRSSLPWPVLGGSSEAVMVAPRRRVGDSGGLCRRTSSPTCNLTGACVGRWRLYGGVKAAVTTPPVDQRPVSVRIGAREASCTSRLGFLGCADGRRGPLRMLAQIRATSAPACSAGPRRRVLRWATSPSVRSSRWIGPAWPFLRLAGAPGRIRTCDRRIRSPLLCPLSYGGATQS